MLISAIVGMIVSSFTTWFIMNMLLSKARIRNKSLHLQLESVKTELLNQSQMIDAFKVIAGDTFSAHISKLTELSESRLEGAGKLISQDLEGKKSAIDTTLGNVSQALRDVLATSSKIEEGLQGNRDQTIQLREVTTGLQQVLSSSQARGSWGERMVEDIIQKLGLVEGVNYHKQQTIQTGERPDFTFALPAGKSIHLDVKFPMAKYEEYINAGNDAIAEAAAVEFIKDVKGHIKSLAARGYIDEKTVDYVILFIPNESIYGFIHHYSSDILDYALDNNVIMASPINLYAVLSLIRQSIKSFSMSEKASEMMEILGKFKAQWAKYLEVQVKMGESIARTQKQYDDMIGTRARGLERTLGKVEEIEAGEGIEMGGGLDPTAPSDTLRVEVDGSVGINK